MKRNERQERPRELQEGAKIHRTSVPAQVPRVTPPPNPLPKGLAALAATPSDARSVLSVIRRTAFGAQACQTNMLYILL